MVKLTLEVSGISIKVMESDKSFKTMCEIEGVVYFIDPKSPGSLGFLGGKERVTIPLTEEHYSLEAFKKHIVALAGLKSEAEKRGLGSSIEIKICRLAKTAGGSSNCLLIAFLSSVASVTYQTRNVRRIQKSILYRLFYTASWFSRKKIADF